jgi:hypothetical protein
VIADGDGREVIQPPRHGSTADALIDPAGDTRYGRGGLEIETGFELNIPRDEAARLGNTSIARSPHFRLVLDKAAGKPIVEIVSQPAAMLRGEQRHRGSVDRDEVFQSIRATIALLHGSPPGATLGEIFAGTDVEVDNRFRDLAVVGESFPDRSVVHYSVGVRLDGMHEFMRFADANSWSFEANSDESFIVEPAKKHMRSALRFGDQVAAAFAGLLEADGSTSMLDHLAAQDHELAGLRGFMAATYTQVAAFVHYYVMQPNVLAKNHTLIAFRMSLGSMRASLPRTVTAWLGEHAQEVEELFNYRLKEDNPDIATAAADRRMKPLDVTWPAIAFNARDYLENATKETPRRSIDQNEALGIRTRFDAMDGDLAVGELRLHGQHITTVDEVERNYREIHDEVNALDTRARSQQDMRGKPAVMRNGRYHLPFDSGAKTLTALQRHQAAGFASYVVEQAADRYAADRSGLTLHAQGGGNGGFNSVGAEAVGLQRAHAALDAVRREIERQLQVRGLPPHIVDFAEPTSRGDAPVDYVSVSAKAARRAVAMWTEYDHTHRTALALHQSGRHRSIAAAGPSGRSAYTPVSGPQISESTAEFLGGFGRSGNSSRDSSTDPSTRS